MAGFGLACLAGLVVASGCTEKLVQPPPPPPILGVPDSIQQVFTANCAFEGCHGGATPQRGMDLTDAQTSYDHIVDVNAVTNASFKRIAPGDSANSYIVMKLRNDARIMGNPMPLGVYPMDPVLVLRVAAWAQAGAPGTPVVTAAAATRP